MPQALLFARGSIGSAQSVISHLLEDGKVVVLDVAIGRE